MQQYFIVLIFLFFSFDPCCAHFSLHTYDTIFNPYIQNQKKIRGVFLLCKNGKTLDVKEVKEKREAQFLVGSLTKQFTAMALLHALIQKIEKENPGISQKALEKKLEELLNKTLSHYLPHNDWIWDGKAPSWIYSISLHHLLTHTSGLINFTELPGFDDFAAIHHSPQEIVKLFKTFSLMSTPGKSFHYNNSGYFLLAQVIERLSGKTYSEYMAERIFIPLKMTSSFSANSGTPFSLQHTHSNLALGHTENVSPQTKYWNMSHTIGAGSLISTVDDLQKWAHSLYKGHPSLKTIAREWLLRKHVQITPTKYYGYGILIHEVPENKDVYDHPGDLPGYFSRMVYNPSSELLLIALENITKREDSIQNFLYRFVKEIRK